MPGSWHPSGRFLAFDELHAATRRDIMVLPMGGDEASGWRAGVPFPFVQGAAMDWSPRFSPDGRWIAYSSTESGRWEIYVRPFPGPGAAVRVSSTGGEMPVWSRAHHEIIYGYEGQVTVVPYTIDGSRFVVGAAHEWPNGRYQTRGRNRMFDLHPDDDHLVLALDTSPPANAEPATASFVFNFFDELQRLAPTSK
jgi:serine/threonine-protein kinase